MDKNFHANINHYIITRFNITLRDQMLNNQVDKIDVNTDEKYLQYRFSLFEEYTIPSIKNQSNKNFDWIVLFSDKTPQKFKNKIQYIQAELPNFRPIFLKSTDELEIILEDIFKQERTGTLVTSRLDNDDALSLNYIQLIQNNIENNGKTELLVFPNGIQFDLKKRVMTRYYFPNNHFSTLICDQNNKLETILGYNHMEIVNHFEVRFLSEEIPMWLELVHGGNILNRMFLKFSILVFDFSILKKFGILNVIPPQNRAITYLLVIFNRPINAYQILSKYGIKKTVIKIFIKIFNKLSKGAI
ncbi:glycosyltransferase [Lactococcus nasutitermitis]|uniref:Glycosyltransferase n=1 Tax=Lactococcus nasutitermitis TaxID=1652957 RepID=A0ABV9JDN2_9LACT|nr:glycosyltransferase [Lactococcus nasutitermitis]